MDIACAHILQNAMDYVFCKHERTLMENGLANTNAHSRISVGIFQSHGVKKSFFTNMQINWIYVPQFIHSAIAVFFLGDISTWSIENSLMPWRTESKSCHLFCDAKSKLNSLSQVLERNEWGMVRKKEREKGRKKPDKITASQWIRISLFLIKYGDVFIGQSDW